MAAAAPLPSAPEAGPGAASSRLAPIDLLRGLVMVVMVLDHVRDFVYHGSFGTDPTDLATTTVALFFTRWVTHFCAPVFVFLAGLGAGLQALRGKDRGELARFLATRGLWLVFLELTAVRVGTFFNFDYRFLGALQVIWALGVSMIVLAALLPLPRALVGGLGLAMIALHNLLDGIHFEGWAGPGSPVPGLGARVWFLLHQPFQMFPVFGEGTPAVIVVYPLVPWLGVMAAGYAAAALWEQPAEVRRTRLLRLGAALVAAFVVLRALNVYGDPRPWSAQPSPVFTALSFLNATKYPVSLLYLLMTLGPALLALGWLEGRPPGAPGRVLATLGRVPLFFYLLQWPLAKVVALAVSAAAGKPVGHLFVNPPVIFEVDPAAGFGLPAVYACWLATLLLLYPPCAWFARLKQRRRDPWLSYL